MAQPHYKLSYFDFKVLGEPLRWQFALAGVPYEDHRIPRSLWEKHYKPNTGWGQVPVLQVDDKELTQAHAIGRYLAASFNQLPETEWQKARCDELVQALQDLRNFWTDWFMTRNAEEKAKYEKLMLEKYYPHYFGKFNELVEENGEGSGFAVGSKVTWADLFLASFLQIYSDTHGSKILKAYPALIKQKETVTNLPQIKEWIEKRPKTAI